MVRLRGHHLICLQFYRGEGYNQDFIKHLFNILERVQYEDVEVVEGVDEVCSVCPYNSGNACVYSDSTAELKIREIDELAVRLLSLSPGSKVKWDEVRKKVGGILGTWREKVCKFCDWNKVCGVETRND
ncbi:MAG: DUF1284 domain-containing protein [Archaeoglobales archaeon]|nr:MAG: DUF1284 domain-containing protein [Archaeoglobales archaeon]